jgi:hypothetical protein
MSQQLIVGKYKFYPYESMKERTRSRDDLAEICLKLKAKRARSRTPPRSRETKGKE